MPGQMRRVAVIASTSGNGKTTLGRALAELLGVPFVELGALVRRPGWTEAPDGELRALVASILASDGWVIDGAYERRLGDLVLRRADTVVWLDLPIRVWFPRLVGRTAGRIRRREDLWSGNRESPRRTLWQRKSFFVWAFRMHYRQRRTLPSRLAGLAVVRLRTPAEVDRFLRSAGSGT